MAFLAGRGFAEFERMRISRLDLAGLPRPDPIQPPGVLLTTLAERPDLVRGVYDVAIETFADIPGGDEPMAVGDLDEFRARDVDRVGIPPDAFMVAVDAATDEVIGYASLIVRRPDGIGEHDMTAVRRAWRGPRRRDGAEARPRSAGRSTTSSARSRPATRRPTCRCRPSTSASAMRHSRTSC